MCDIVTLSNMIVIDKNASIPLFTHQDQQITYEMYICQYSIVRAMRRRSY